MAGLSVDLSAVATVDSSAGQKVAELADHLADLWAVPTDATKADWWAVLMVDLLAARRVDSLVDMSVDQRVGQLADLKVVHLVVHLVDQ